MELNLQRRMTGLKDKIPDIQKTLDTVQFLKLRKVGLHSLWFRNMLLSRRAGRNRSHRNDV